MSSRQRKQSGGSPVAAQELATSRPGTPGLVENNRGTESSGSGLQLPQGIEGGAADSSL